MQFNPKQLQRLKDICLQIQRGNINDTLETEITTFFQEVSRVEVLLLEHLLLNQTDGITKKGIMKLAEWQPHIFLQKVEKAAYPEEHPILLFQKENHAIQQILLEMHELLDILETSMDIKTVHHLQEITYQLGEFHRHFHRKEKLYFPILEKYGHHTPTRMDWRKDDHIKALYQGVKRQISALPTIKFSHVMQMFIPFEKEFTEMIFQEEAIFLPLFHELFQEEDWLRIADESDAFGYTLIEEPPKLEKPNITNSSPIAEHGTENIKFGGGFLTTEEANLIFNHLPLEITFVDKHSVFKYFNTITEASDMMLVRTPTSIGRNVADCHPPRSLNKVMTLIRDLKSKKRTTENMWFKKGETYVHITYKALFNEADEYMGILEYVQDIQPFFNLPSDIKRGLSDVSNNTQ